MNFRIIIPKFILFFGIRAFFKVFRPSLLPYLIEAVAAMKTDIEGVALSLYNQ